MYVHDGVHVRSSGVIVPTPLNLHIASAFTAVGEKRLKRSFVTFE